MRSSLVINRFAALLALLSVLPLISPFYAQAQSPDSARTDTNVYSGIYRNADGSQARLFKPEDSEKWVMNVAEASGTDYTLIMKGTAGDLKPVGLDLSVMYRGKPMKIVAEGDTLYGRGKSGKKSLEIYADDQQTAPRSTIDRETASSAEAIETRLLAQRYQSSWDQIRNSSISVNDTALTINPPQKKRAGGAADSSRNLQHFSPEAELEKRDQKSLTRKLKSWQDNLTDRDDYLKNVEGSSNNE